MQMRHSSQAFEMQEPAELGTSMIKNGKKYVRVACPKSRLLQEHAVAYINLCNFFMQELFRVHVHVKGTSRFCYLSRVSLLYLLMKPPP